MLLFVFERYFGLLWGARGARRRIISGIDRARGARSGMGSSWLGIDRCANRTRVYLNIGLFWALFVVFWVLGGLGGGGARKKIISGIDVTRLARLGIGND